MKKIIFAALAAFLVPSLMSAVTQAHVVGTTMVVENALCK